MRTLSLNPEALAENLSLARSWAPSGARVRAMVKANAYGHGLEPLAAVFARDADELGVATLDEGIWLRSHVGATVPIFMMSGEKDWEHQDYFDAVRMADVVPVVSSVEELRMILGRVNESNSFQVELKLDSGMGRMGITESDLRGLVVREGAFEGLSITGVLTHFASADEENLTSVRRQERRLKAMLSELSNGLTNSAAVHSCNSGALMHRGLGRLDIGSDTQVVRPGVMLYGAGPSRFLHDSPSGRALRPVGRWTTRVIDLKNVPPGESVGYGGTWSVEGDRPARVAVLAIGYADGFRRVLGNRGRVLIRGRSFPVIGRVSMDVISVLVNDQVRRGDEAVIIGSQSGELGSDMISVWEIAELCDTIPYEIWTSIGPRVGRVLDTE